MDRHEQEIIMDMKVIKLGGQYVVHCREPMFLHCSNGHEYVQVHEYASQVSRVLIAHSVFAPLLNFDQTDFVDNKKKVVPIKKVDKPIHDPGW